MILTTYFHKLKDLPDDYVKLIVTRWPPKWLDLSRFKNTKVIKDLSPNEYILAKYKQDNNWGDFEKSFSSQMRESPTNEAINIIGDYLKNGVKIALICYEKDPEICHRTLLATEIKQRFGVEFKEF